MSKSLRVLLVEDSERDAALLNLYLRRGGIDPMLQRVETAAQMKEQLEKSEWDIVISDFLLPGFDARRALGILRESRRELPLIIVSGGVADEAIQEVLNEGATDYLCKDQMRDIVSVIERAMQTRT